MLIERAAAIGALLFLGACGHDHTNCSPALIARDDLYRHGVPHHRTVGANHIRMIGIKCPAG